jgi:hypothetical protein
MRLTKNASTSSLSFALALAMAGPMAVLLTSSASVAAPAKEAKYSELTAQAQAHRDAGRYAEAAQAFAEAYDMLEEREQRGLKGEITIGNAMDDYRSAQEEAPDSMGLLFQEAALLERYGNRLEGLPEDLGKELERVKARMEELRVADESEAARRRAAEEERRAAEAKQPKVAPEPVDVLTKVKQPEVAPEPVDVLTKTKQPEVAPEPIDELAKVKGSRSRRAADFAVLGVGLTAFVGGTAMIANGVWNLGKVERRRDALLATLDAYGGGTPQMRESLRDEIESWHGRWRGIGTGLAVGGGALAAVGIGLTTWGVLRMRKGKQGSGRVSVAWPMGLGRGVGISLVGRY